MKHTPEPWQVDDNDPYLISSSEGKHIGAITEEADSAHIVACVNACAGISDEDIKCISDIGGFDSLTLGNWIKLKQELDELQERNSRLSDEIVRQSNQNADLVVKNAELHEQLKQTERRMQDAVDALNADTEQELSFKHAARKAEQRHDELLAAFEKYASHHNGCDWYGYGTRTPEDQLGECSCGRIDFAKAQGDKT